MTATTAPELNELRALGCATLHEAQGQTGAMNASVKPLDASMRLVGRTFTVDARPGDNLVLHLAVTRAKPVDLMGLGPSLERLQLG